MRQKCQFMYHVIFTPALQIVNTLLHYLLRVLLAVRCVLVSSRIESTLVILYKIVGLRCTNACLVAYRQCKINVLVAVFMVLGWCLLGEITGDERRTCSGACGACEVVACSHRGQDTGRDHRARSPRTGRDHRPRSPRTGRDHRARSPRTGRDHPGRDRRRPRSPHTI